MTVPSGTSYERPAAADVNDLPPSDSPTLKLVRLEDDEKENIWILNGQSWKGAIPIDAYIRREHFLAKQLLTKEGGISYWALVDTASTTLPRPILSSCETLRKKAISVRRGGQIQEELTHGIGSVFCREEYRGRGYAARMMEELGKHLETWQQENGKRAKFSLLWSDIGKKFYARKGWHPYLSSHVDLPPMERASNASLPATLALGEQDIAKLCEIDERIIRKTILKFTSDGPNIRVALLPDHATIQWHHAREEFVAQELFDRKPEIKGALVRGRDGKATWCIWTRVWQVKAEENVLHILRLVVEGENDFESEDDDQAVASSTNGSSNGVEPSKAHVEAAAACLQAAQLEASTWNIKAVQIWNPSHTIMEAAKLVHPSAKLSHRDSESISSLRWYGDQHDRVEWIGNEKYGWC